MDVCFITKGGREAFLGARIERRPGAIVDTDGAVVGAHDGIDAFTIGQRRGLAVAVGERRYVIDIAPATGTVTIGTRDDLLRDRVDTRRTRRGRPACAPEGPVLVAVARARRRGARAARRRRRVRFDHAAAARRAGSGGRAATTATSCSAAASRVR